jgi:hypothetical protein
MRRKNEVISEGKARKKFSASRFALERLTCKAFCEFRTVYENDYLRVPYNNQK